MTPIAALLCFALLGLGLGGLHFASLHRNVRGYLHGERTRPLVLHVVRLVFVGLAWVVLARFGGSLGLLAAFAGFLVARSLVTARVGRAA